jgi:hypothetical protein
MMTVQQFLKSIDFKNVDKLSACDIGYDEDLDLALRTGCNDE